MIELLAQTCLNAVYAASYISLVAVGLVLIFGVMGVINFAHGELFMAGAYAVVTFYADLHLPFLVAVALGLLHFTNRTPVTIIAAGGITGIGIVAAETATTDYFAATMR